jgi:hypothetical protein
VPEKNTRQNIWRSTKRRIPVVKRGIYIHYFLKKNKRGRYVSLVRSFEDAHMNRDGFGSDTHENESECHYLPYFNFNLNTNIDTIGYEYKTDSSNLDSHSDTYLVWNITS